MITMLHNYFRSSTSFRVRIALAMKDIAYAQSFRHLRKGEQRSADYLAINPQGLVPTLDIDGHHLTQSMAILEYLEETHPSPPLLPKDAAGRARVRSLAMMIACEIHPLGNLRVLADLRTPLRRRRCCGRRLVSPLGDRDLPATRTAPRRRA